MNLIFWTLNPVSCRWFIHSILRNFLFTLAKCNRIRFTAAWFCFLMQFYLYVYTHCVNGLFGNVDTTKMYFSSTTNNLFKSTWIFYEDLWWNVLSLDIIELIFSSKYLSILSLPLPSSIHPFISLLCAQRLFSLVGSFVRSLAFTQHIYCSTCSDNQWHYYCYYPSEGISDTRSISWIPLFLILLFH